MAKCEKRQIDPVPPPVEYVLTLSEAEAKAVRACLGRDYGDFTKEPYIALLRAMAVEL